MADVFGDSAFTLQNIGSEKAKQIIKHRAIIEQKEKGEDMAKTVGETKVFMSAHGIQGALKPLKPRIKKLVNRKANEFKKGVSNKINDFIDGDGGKNRRLQEFKDKQSDLNDDPDFNNVKKRFGELGDEDKASIRENIKANPNYTSKDDLDELDEAQPNYDNITSRRGFAQENNKMKSKLSDLDKDTKKKLTEDIDNDPNVKSSLEIQDIADPEEKLAQRTIRSKAINDKIDELSPENSVGELKVQNTNILRDEVSNKETSNFIENDAKSVAESEEANIGEDAGSIVSKISNFAKSGSKALADGVNSLNKTAVSSAKALTKGAIKSEAKTMAKGTVEADIGEETAGEVGAAALDAIPFADIAGLFVGAGIAIKKAVQVRKLEKKDEGLVAAAPVVGSLQQVGV